MLPGGQCDELLGRTWRGEREKAAVLANADLDILAKSDIVAI